MENPDYETRQRIKRNPILTAGRPSDGNDGSESESTKNALDLLLESGEPPARIAKNMNFHGHSTWGFVVYRCTYLDDAQWDEFKDFLVRETTEMVTDDGWPDDFIDALNIRFFDDKASFDGATKADIRKHFEEWVESPEAIAEQPHRVDVGPVSAPVKLLLWKTAPRYTYCLQVDEEALSSVIGLIQDDDGIPYANLIDSTWGKPLRITRPWEQGTADLPSAGNVDDGGSVEDEEAIEGCTSYYVGWMKVDLRDCMPACYNDVGRDGNGFERSYVRPPGVYSE